MPSTTTGSMRVIRLGFREVPVVAQKHAYLRRYLSYEDFQKVMSREYSGEAYKLLCTLIPAINPSPRNGKPNPDYVIQEWEFDGFPTEEAWKDYHGGNLDAYDEENDPGPTTDEIAQAFETALLVNGAGRLGKIVTLVQSATRVIELEDQQVTVLSNTLPGNSGESESTNSGTTAQI